MDTKKLRQKILDLAIRGKLIPQDPNDEPVSVLIEKIRVEKEQLIKEKKIKRDKNESYIYRSDKSYYEKFPDGTVKCIDEEIPFEIPESWKIVRLGDFCFLKAGQFVSAKDINKKYNSQLNPCYGGNGLRGYVKTYTHDGDFALIGRQGALCGNVNYVSGRFHATEHAVVVQNFGSYINSKWLYYTLVAMNLNQYSAGAAQPGLNVSVLNRLYISLPPRREQNRIVERIGFALALIGDIEANKLDLIQFVKTTKSKILDLAIQGKLVPQDLNDEPASVLLERIKAEHPESKKKAKNTGDNSHYENLEWVVPPNWCWCLLSDICFFERGITFPSSAKRIFKEEHLIPCIRTANVQEQLELEDLWYIDSIYVKNNKNKLVRNGDIIMSSANSRELVGKTSYVQNIDSNMTFGGFVLNIRANKIDTKYLFYLLRCYFDKGIFMTESTQTTNIANINSTILGNLKIPLPPLNEQTRIAYQIEFIFNKLDNIIAEL